MNEKEKELYKKAIDHWGIPAQLKVATEESAELIVEIVKYQRSVNGSTINSIAQEVADVEIMMDQLKVVFNFEDMVEKLKKVKLERLEQLIKNAKKEPKKVCFCGGDIHMVSDTKNDVVYFVCSKCKKEYGG